MPDRYRLRSFRGWSVLLVVLLVAGCGGSPSGGGQPTGPGGSSANCATRPTATGEAWVTNNQVEGSINGSPTMTLSNFSYPLGLPGEGQFGTDQLSALFWAPDAKHLAVVVTVFQGQSQVYYPYVVDTTTRAVTRIMLPGATVLSAPGAWVPWRLLAWADTHTLLIFAAGSSGGSESTISYSYDLNNGTLSALPGVTSAAEGVVRCSTLFYLDLTPLKQVGNTGALQGTALLHRYDLTSQSEIGRPVTLGDTSSSPGAEGNLDFPGWDASPDGSHIAYEQTRFSGTSLSAQFMAARADGSGAAAILSGITPQPDALMAISPNGLLVAVTNTGAASAVVSGAMSGGPAHAYSPNSDAPPVWLGDSSGFEANVIDESGSSVERYPLNTGDGTMAGMVAVPGASNPAILA
jgi:hypothetical protein